MVALLLILSDCGVAINTLFKHFLRSDRPQLSSACTKNQLSRIPSEIFNLKRKRPRNLREQIRNFREEVVRAGCKLLRANCQSKYQHCGGSLQSCAEKNMRFDCNKRGVRDQYTGNKLIMLRIATNNSQTVGNHLLNMKGMFSQETNDF